MNQLIPFKVTLRVPVPEYWRNKHTRHDLSIEHTEGIWTVVGIDFDDFLLAKVGTLTRWYPSDLCDVYEVR
jgi:hypothetical protein